MRRTSLTTFALAVFALALLAAIGAWFLYSDVSSRVSERAQLLSSAATENAQQANSIEVTALATETSAQRSELDQEVSADVVGIASEIQSAGKASGAATVIGSATAGETNSTSSTTPLTFVVQETGSFAEVWRAAQLLGTLPLPSNVQELDFEQFPGAGNKPDSWQLTARVEVLTNSQISS